MAFTTRNEKVDKYLDELADEYKQLLFARLIESSPSIDDLNISTLLRIDSEVKRALMEPKPKQERRRQLLFIAGIAYMISGMLGYLISGEVLESKMDAVTIASIVVMLTGLCITMYSYFLPTLFFKVHADSVGPFRNATNRVIAYEVITRWRDIEGVVNDLDVKSAPSNSRSAIQFLFENKYINEKEEAELRSFLKLRNEVVHSDLTKLSNEDMRNAIKRIDVIINKLR